jgi:O-antigen ligase/Flp pilus assembly protein TadD
VSLRPGNVRLVKPRPAPAGLPPMAVPVLVMFALVPVAFDPGGWAAFGPLKWALISTLVLMAAGLALLEGQLWVHRPSGLIAAGFLVWVAVCAFWGLDRGHAWLGTPDRHLGVAAWVLFVLCFWLGQNLAPQARLLVRAAALGLGLVGVYCLLELAGRAPVDLATVSARLGGPFGSAAYLGAACTLLIPLAAVGAVDVTEPRRWRVGAAAAAILGVVALLGSQTRGAVVGLAVAAAFLVPLAAKMFGRRWVMVTAALLVAVVMVSPVGDRLRSVWLAGEGGGRLADWQMGLRVLGDHPIVGVGPEGYRIAFPGVVDAAYERRFGREVAPDRAHSGPLDVGINFGLLGLAIYLVAAGWLWWLALGAARRGAVLQAGVEAGVGAAVAGYLAQQLLLFPVVEIDPLFWVAAGVLVGGRVLHPVRTFRPAAALVLALAVAAAVAGYRDIAADRSVMDSYNELGAGRGRGALAAADRAAALRPDSIRYWFVAADVASRATGDGALLPLSRALAISPNDPILLSTQAQYLLDRARVSGVAGDIEAAVSASRRRVEDDPHNAQDRLRLGLVLVLAGDLTGAEKQWLAAADLAPRSPVPWFNLVRLYVELGRPGDARTALTRAAGIDPTAPEIADLQRLLAETADGG